MTASGAIYVVFRESEFLPDGSWERRVVLAHRAAGGPWTTQIIGYDGYRPRIAVDGVTLHIIYTDVDQGGVVYRTGSAANLSTSTIETGPQSGFAGDVAVADVACQTEGAVA